MTPYPLSILRVIRFQLEQLRASEAYDCDM
jgi:hypothetical protein